MARIHCDQCNMLSINGIPCHETGCPNERKVWSEEEGRWLTIYKCPECGLETTSEVEARACCAPVEEEEKEGEDDEPYDDLVAGDLPPWMERDDLPPLQDEPWSSSDNYFNS